MRSLAPAWVVVAVGMAGWCAAGCGSGDSTTQADGSPGADGAPSGDAAGADAGSPDAAVISDEIQQVRASSPGTLNRRVNSWRLAYASTAVGDDPAGGFFQNQPLGPAIFAVGDLASLGAQPGWRMSFVIGQTEVVSGQIRIKTLTSITVTNRPDDTATIVQNLSTATDLVSALDSYESELVTVTGTLAGTQQPSGTGHSEMQLVTAGVNSPDLVLRAPTPLFTANNLRAGCTVTIGPSPLWRTGTRAQVQAYQAAHLTVSSCP